MYGTTRITKKTLHGCRGYINIAVVTLLMAGIFSISPTPASAATAIIVAQAQALSLDEATAKVRKITQGRVLSAEEQLANERRVYRIKILTPNSKVKVFIVDVTSGSVAEE